MSDDEGECYVYSDDDSENVGGDTKPRRECVGLRAGAAPPFWRPHTPPPPPPHRLASPPRFTSLSSFGGADYRVLREDEIRLEQERVQCEVAGLLAIPPECAGLLLLHCKWNKERACEVFLQDRARACAAAGIATLGASSRASAPFTCGVCWEDRPAAAGYGMGCRHVFCKGCWADFLSAAVTDTGAGCILSR